MATMSSSYSFPEALPHGEMTEVFPGVFFVKGSVKMSMGLVTMSFSRNMTIVRQTKDLILINSVRLDEDGLKELDKLGKVKHVIRLAGFHGMDDPFYKDRYDCTVWGPKGGTYFSGFEKDAEPYFQQDKDISSNTVLPIKDSKAILIDSAEPSEALVLMNRPDGKRILVSGDCLQNYVKADEYFSFLSSIMMRLMGFIKPYNVGPAWYKTTKPDKSQIESLLDLEFDHVLPSHGEPCVGEACSKYEPVIKGLN